MSGFRKILMVFVCSLVIGSTARAGGPPPPDTMQVPHDLAQQQSEVQQQLDTYRWQFAGGYAAQACDVIDVQYGTTLIFKKEPSCIAALSEDNLSVLRAFYDPSATVTIGDTSMQLEVGEKLVYDVYWMFMRDGDWKDPNQLGLDVQKVCGSPIYNRDYINVVWFAPSAKCKQTLRKNVMALTNYGISYSCDSARKSTCTVSQLGPWGDITDPFLNPKSTP